MISKLRAPIYVQVELTSACNNKCLYCYNFWRTNRDRHEKQRKNLSGTELEAVAEALGKADIFYVTITGGEPFLRRDELYRFMESLRRRNIRLMINSNATLIDEQEAEKLSAYPIEIFLASLISWNAAQHDQIASSPGAHERTVAGIKNLQKAGIPVAINMVATKMNCKEVYQTGRWVSEKLGIQNFSATPICPSLPEHHVLELDKHDTAATIAQLFLLRKERGMRVDILEVLPACMFDEKDSADLPELLSARMCTAGNTTITIGSEGDVRVCSYDNHSYGNILTDNFDAIWRQMASWRNDSLLPAECLACSILKECGGGCRVSAYVKTQNYCQLDARAKGAIRTQRSRYFSARQTLSPDLELRAADKLLFRKERPGIFLVVANSAHFVLTNDDGLAFFRRILSMNSFTLKSLAESSGMPMNSLRPFLTELHLKGFVSPPEKSKKEGR